MLVTREAGHMYVRRNGKAEHHRTLRSIWAQVEKKKRKRISHISTKPELSLAPSTMTDLSPSPFIVAGQGDCKESKEKRVSGITQSG